MAVFSLLYRLCPRPSKVRDKQGWIKFGQPGVPTEAKARGREYYVKPEPGLLVLFPSYMWHGTVPFEGDDSRLTVAFDLASWAEALTDQAISPRTGGASRLFGKITVSVARPSTPRCSIKHAFEHRAHIQA